MGVDIIRPRVCDLTFQVYGRPLHPELFDILAVRKVQREDYELTVRITRTGHVISFSNRSAYLTEVAATDQPLPETRRLLRYRLRGEHTDTVLCAGGISYQTSFQVEVLAPEIFLHVHDEIMADGGKRRTPPQFPAASSAGPRAVGLRVRRGQAGLPLPVRFSHLPRRAHGHQDSIPHREAGVTLHHPLNFSPVTQRADLLEPRADCELSTAGPLRSSAFRALS